MHGLLLGGEAALALADVGPDGLGRAVDPVRLRIDDAADGAGGGGYGLVRLLSKEAPAERLVDALLGSRDAVVAAGSRPVGGGRQALLRVARARLGVAGGPSRSGTPSSSRDR